MRSRARRGLGLLAAWALPVGVVGIGGVVAVALYLVTFGRRALPGEWRLIAAAAPLALLPVVATLVYGAEGGGSGGLGYALGMAALLLLAPVAVRRMLAGVGVVAAMVAFVAGACVLAISVWVDAVLGWHTIPVGLFRGGTLHNVTAAVLVVAFGPALGLAGATRWRAFGIAAALVIAAGVVVALSWVGVLGLLAVALVYAASARGMRVGAVGVLVTGAAGGVVWWAASRGWLRVPELATLGEVLGDRARIAAQGLALAAERPWLGWGVHLGDLDGPLGAAGLGVYHVDDLALTHFHSVYVQTLFEAGVPGLMALALWFGALLLAQRGPWRGAVRAALVGFLVTQAFDIAWHHASVMTSMTLVAMIGLVPAAHEAETDPPGAPPGAREGAAP